MKRLWKRHRELTIAILAIAVPLYFYFSNTKNPREHNVLDRVVVTLSSPVHWMVSTTYFSWLHAVQRMTSNEALAGRIVDLEKENQSLRWALAMRADTEQEVQRLRVLLDMQDSLSESPTLAARITGRSAHRLFRSIQIDKGSVHGVVAGAAVVCPFGIVGRVVNVTPWSADVILSTDTNNSLAVLNTRSRVQARVRGTSRSDILHFEHLPADFDMAPGDMIVTSGLGGTFPAGIEVGRIESITMHEAGVHQDGVVRLGFDIGRLQEVLVLLSSG